MKKMNEEMINNEKEEYIKEYVKNGGNLWSFDNISIIRDGGTIMLIRPPQSKLNPFYLHKDIYSLLYLVSKILYK